MAKNKEKNLALELRSKGLSYSQIKNRINVSKSTLNLWLKNLPLTKEQIALLRDKNPARIEKFRNTMQAKRIKEELDSFGKIKSEIGDLTVREKILGGLFLYWGEGTKAARGTVALTNTDPDSLKFFVSWLRLLGVRVSQMKVVLHLYSDMNIEKEMQFWSDYLRIPIGQFRKPYIKKTKLADLTYKVSFGHGTCSVLYLNKDLYLYVMSGIKYLRDYPPLAQW